MKDTFRFAVMGVLGRETLKKGIFGSKIIASVCSALEFSWLELLAALAPTGILLFQAGFHWMLMVGTPIGLAGQSARNDKARDFIQK